MKKPKLKTGKKKNVWKKGYSPKDKREAEAKKAEKLRLKELREAEIAKEFERMEKEKREVNLKVLRLNELLDSKKPINELHKLMFFDKPLGKEYLTRITDTPYQAYHKVISPETLTLDELISIAGFLQVNAVWLFCRLYANYTEVLGEAAKNNEEAALRFKRAYFLQELSRQFQQPQSHQKDVQNGTYVLSKLLPPDQLEVDSD